MLSKTILVSRVVRISSSTRSCCTITNIIYGTQNRRPLFHVNSRCSRILANRFRSSGQKKIESYFNAIGGQSDDPPPDLTPEQVRKFLY